MRLLSILCLSLAQEDELRRKVQELEDRVKKLEGQKSPSGFKVDAPLLDSLVIGGQIRLRGEFRDVADYKAPGDDYSTTVYQRVRIHLDAGVSKKLRAFVQFQDGRVWGDDPVGGDTSDFDMKQGFLEIREIGDLPLAVKAGRMELPTLGDGRLVSPLDWSNTGRSWDGIHATFSPEGWSVQLWGVNLAEGSVFGSRSKNDYSMAGIYASCRKLEKHEFDVYVFGRALADDDFGSEVGGSLGPRKDGTFGFRAKGKTGPVDYSGEIAFQYGDQADDDVRAWAAAFTAGFTFEHDWKPRVGVEVAFASGDDDPTDGDVGTFDPIFPFAHSYHGHADLIGWRNLHAILLSVRVRPMKDWTLHLDGHAFRLAEDRDAWYSAAGTAIRRDTTGSADPWVGYEIDLYAKWKCWERLEFWAGYSHFFAGGFVKDTGEDHDQDWVFLQVLLNL